MVGETAVLAAMRAGEVIGDAPLIRQAELVAAMGETFEGVDGKSISASLDGPPLAVILTLIRACDHPLAIELGPAGPPDLWGSQRS
jgi:hypothetical protein